jgi:hypothetical protein
LAMALVIPLIVVKAPGIKPNKKDNITLYLPSVSKDHSYVWLLQRQHLLQA